MDQPTPVRMAFVEDSLDATKAYEQARRALLTQLRWESQRSRDAHHSSDAQIRDWLRPQRLPEDICDALCATPSGATPSPPQGWYHASPPFVTRPASRGAAAAANARLHRASARGVCLPVRDCSRRAGVLQARPSSQSLRPSTMIA